MKKPVFTGAGVAIVTPFNPDGSVNFKKLGELLDYQIENGTDAVVICGTTGETSVLSTEVHIETVQFTCDYVNHRIPVIAGAGSNDTAYAVNMSNAVEKAGADAILSVTPYYNKTSQRGLIQHFNFIADRVSIPIITYNVPSRTGVNILPETYLELSSHPRINGSKEASGNISALAKSIALCGDNMNFYSGNDDQITSFMSLGAKGVISVLSNVAPKTAHDIAAEYLNGNTEESRRLQLEWLDLCNDLFIDVNPIPVKEAMNMMGFDVGECKLPLYKLTDEAHNKLYATMAKHGLIDVIK